HQARRAVSRGDCDDAVVGHGTGGLRRRAGPAARLAALVAKAASVDPALALVCPLSGVLTPPKSLGSSPGCTSHASSRCAGSAIKRSREAGPLLPRLASVARVPHRRRCA